MRRFAGKKGPGDVVNIENDVIGKYVEKLMGLGPVEVSLKKGRPHGGKAWQELGFLRRMYDISI